MSKMFNIPGEKADRKKIDPRSLIGIPLDRLPTNFRPKGVGDLGYGEAHDEAIFTLPDSIASNPDLIGFWADVVRAAKKYPSLQVQGSSIKRPLTGEDIDAKIADRQKRYDEHRENYWKYLNGELPMEGYYYHNVHVYMDREGMPGLSDIEGDADE